MPPWQESQNEAAWQVSHAVWLMTADGPWRLSHSASCDFGLPAREAWQPGPRVTGTPFGIFDCTLDRNYDILPDVIQVQLAIGTCLLVWAAHRFGKLGRVKE